MDLLTRLAHARALDRLGSTALGEPLGLPGPSQPAPPRITEASAAFERRELVLTSDRPAMLGACLDRLVLPTGLALARDLVCLGAGRGVRPVFIDTETTGLGGVALPFMVGVAWYAQDGLTITQWTLSRLGGEAELLADVLATLRTLGPDPLVSFNGASFDLPLLRVRARRHGLCDQVLAAAGLDHVDLLHPARRIHAGRGIDCRLGTLERDLLGLRRRGDIDSAQIPAVFWSALQTPEDPQAQRRLQAVREHNVVDLASLPALAARLAQAIREPDDLERARRAARHFAKLGAHEQARLLLTRWVAPGLARAQAGQALAQTWREAALELAELERRHAVGLGARERAAALWCAAWQQAPSCPRSSEAWAKHLEHHAQDFAEALRVARASRLACPRRIARLERKLARAQPVASAEQRDPNPSPLLAPGPRVRLDLRQSPRSELLSVIEDESSAKRRYRLLR